MKHQDLEMAGPHYTYLRGLFLIPFGLLSIVAALTNWEVGPFEQAWTFPVAALAVAGLCVLINRYYNERYGRISPNTRQRIRGALAVVAGLVVVLGGSLLLRSRVEWSLDLPVNATAVSFALVMLISYAFGIGLKPHHVVIWGALLLAGAIPVWTGGDPSNVGLVMAGVTLMVSGVFDHRLFVHTFGSAALPDLEDPSLGA